MTDGCFQISSVNNNLNEWDFDEILRYKDQECFVYDGKRIRWKDNLERLKIFTNCAIGQTGIWSSPGGKYRKFTISNCDLTFSWNYERGLLSFQGKTGDRLKELLINICTNKESSPAYFISSEAVDLNTASENASNNKKSLYDGQTEHNATKIPSDGGRVNSKSVLSPPSCDYSTLGELQDFIDQSFQEVIYCGVTTIRFPHKLLIVQLHFVYE
jgi:hypothetical protein